MIYLKSLAAYLTGWVIANAAFSPIRRRTIKREWRAEKVDIARRVADELEARMLLRNERCEGPELVGKPGGAQ